MVSAAEAEIEALLTGSQFPITYLPITYSPGSFSLKKNCLVAL